MEAGFNCSGGSVGTKCQGQNELEKHFGERVRTMYVGSPFRFLERVSFGFSRGFGCQTAKSPSSGVGGQSPIQDLERVTCHLQHLSYWEHHCSSVVCD